MVKGWCSFLAVIIFLTNAEGQTPKEHWVDSVFRQMTLADKIGQIFMITVDGSTDASDVEAIATRIETHKIGGVAFKKGNGLTQLNAANLFQSKSRIPLLIGMDGTNTINAPADSAVTFPGRIIQGAVTDDSLVYLLGKEIGRQMKLLGAHLNFIPANISNGTGVEERNSFGELPEDVAEKSMAYWRGLQSQGVVACAKYFPIQGVSVANLQGELPAIDLTVDSSHVHPFKELAQAGLPALMPAGTDLPLFYSQKKTALKNLFSSSTLSASFAGSWIRLNMDYKGLIMIDIDNMVRASDKFGNGEAEVFAFRAGNDLLVTSPDIAAAIRRMKRLLRREKQFVPVLEQSVRKILELKYDAGLHRFRPADPLHLPQRLLTPESQILRAKLYRSAVTVVANEKNIIPVQSLDNRRFSCLATGDSLKGEVFAAQLSKYVPVSLRHYNGSIARLMAADSLQGGHLLVVAVFPETDDATLNTLIPLIKEARINRDVIICDFGSEAFRFRANEFETVITAYTDDLPMILNVAQVVFGALPATGRLPVSYSTVRAGKHITTPSLSRLSYSFPEDAGIDSKTLQGIDAIARDAIQSGATPGCYVLVAKDGKVVYEKPFGYLTYENQFPVTPQTIYDLASLTKVSATLQAVMFLHEKGLIDINKKASVYLPELRNSNKEDFTLKDILTHQAGLWPYLPFWAQTMQDSVYLPAFYNDTLSRQYPVVVADNLYGSTAMRDSLWQWIIKARIREKAVRTPYDYRYSDMGFYVLQRLADKLLNQPMEDFLWQNLYEPLGSYTTGYTPLVRFPAQRIAPTENDRLFRRSLLIGTVHDQGAAMMGGIAGHAGLFSNANDLAKLGQMLLQEGQYGGLRYYKPETVQLFTRRHFANNRRGLGWDKPAEDWAGPTGYYASPATFGHTGFTGTCLWVDPEFNLVYVFLSNRVHPDMTNNKLLNDNIRPRIQDVVYRAIFNYCKTNGMQPGLAPEALPELMGRHYNK